LTGALFVDTSALARVYLEDEPDSSGLRALILDSGEAVVASELARVELARSAIGAERSGRLVSATILLQRVDADLAGPIGIIDLEPSTVLPRARELVLEHRLGTLDAIHLAVAIEFRTAEDDEPITFVTRDADQAAAAKALGFELA
jgi:predicted nucleic acid-binding protein